jgi:hypothetical protein
MVVIFLCLSDSEHYPAVQSYCHTVLIKKTLFSGSPKRRENILKERSANMATGRNIFGIRIS